MSSRLALVVVAAAGVVGGCRAGAREGLPPAPPYGALVNRPAPPSPAPAPVPERVARSLAGRVEYYQISDG